MFYFFSFVLFLMFFFVFKQKTVYEMRIRDWSSDVCSSDLEFRAGHLDPDAMPLVEADRGRDRRGLEGVHLPRLHQPRLRVAVAVARAQHRVADDPGGAVRRHVDQLDREVRVARARGDLEHRRSEEHTSELQSLMRISYAVFCLKNKKTIQKT